MTKATARAAFASMAVAGFSGCGDEEPAAPRAPAVVVVQGGFVNHAFPVYRGRTFAFGGLVVRAPKGKPVTLLDARPSRPTAPLAVVDAYSAGPDRKLFGFQSSLVWPDGEQTKVRALKGTRVDERPDGVEVIVRLRTAAEARAPVSFEALDIRTRAADGTEQTTRVPVRVKVCPRGPTRKELLAERCALPAK